jgi:hypothetical protein
VASIETFTSIPGVPGRFPPCREGFGVAGRRSGAPGRRPVRATAGIESTRLRFGLAAVDAIDMDMRMSGTGGVGSRPVAQLVRGGAGARRTPLGLLTASTREIPPRGFSR